MYFFFVPERSQLSFAVQWNVSPLRMFAIKDNHITTKHTIACVHKCEATPSSLLVTPTQLSLKYTLIIFFLSPCSESTHSFRLMCMFILNKTSKTRQHNASCAHERGNGTWCDIITLSQFQGHWVAKLWLAHMISCVCTSCPLQE